MILVWLVWAWAAPLTASEVRTEAPDARALVEACRREDCTASDSDLARALAVVAAYDALTYGEISPARSADIRCLDEAVLSEWSDLLPPARGAPAPWILARTVPAAPDPGPPSPIAEPERSDSRWTELSFAGAALVTVDQPEGYASMRARHGLGPALALGARVDARNSAATWVRRGARNLLGLDVTESSGRMTLGTRLQSKAGVLVDIDFGIGAGVGTFSRAARDRMGPAAHRAGTTVNFAGGLGAALRIPIGSSGPVSLDADLWLAQVTHWTTPPVDAAWPPEVAIPTGPLRASERSVGVRYAPRRTGWTVQVGARSERRSTQASPIAEDETRPIFGPSASVGWVL